MFGSDRGLVGQLNDVVVDHAVKTPGALADKPQDWAVGERVHARLKDASLLVASLLKTTEAMVAEEPEKGTPSAPAMPLEEIY
jgi:F-type H+-transporting ATPase subunit gamma